MHGNIIFSGGNIIVSSAKTLWSYILNKPKWQLFLEFVLSVIVSSMWMGALLIFLAEYDPWNRAGTSIDEKIFSYGGSFILYCIIFTLSFFFFGRRKLLASIIITTTYLLVPLLIGIVGFCISTIFLFLSFSQDALFIFICTGIMACVTLGLFYSLAKKKDQYFLLLGDREGSFSDLVRFWDKNYIFLLLHIGLVTAFIFFLYASGFMRDS